MNPMNHAGAGQQRVALVFGGVSPEHEVSILSACQVIEGLRTLAARVALEVDAVYINREGEWIWRTAQGGGLPSPEIMEAAPRWDVRPEEFGVDVLEFTGALERLRTRSIDVAFLVLHGQNGEDGRLQGALDLAGIAYTGPGAVASALCFKKPLCQAVLNAARLPIAPSAVIRGERLAEAAARLPEVVGLPCVIKPAQGGSSVGISIVREAEQVQPALERALEIDDEVMAEKYVQGREFTCGVIERDGEPCALPVTEIIPPEGRFYDYQAKYFDEATRLVTPARVPAGLAARIQSLAVMAFGACGCRGFSRVDFLCDVNAAAEPVILEINTIPGMTSHSLLPQAAAVQGIAFPELLELMLASARHD